jgi:hypothetical protein
VRNKNGIEILDIGWLRKMLGQKNREVTPARVLPLKKQPSVKGVTIGKLSNIWPSVNKPFVSSLG